ncbi:kinesin motor domain-containing protein [Baffinella frigidus]|nr:kinesin motor domain-containing protein [Cryptophyta sp. CCMP2293]
MAERGAGSLQIKAHYIQVYNEQLTDLLSGRPVQLRGCGGEGGFSLQGAEEVDISSQNDFFQVLARGEANKRYGATAMNARSSRAHTVLAVALTHIEDERRAKSARRAAPAVVRSQLVLADLAGSEKISKSMVTGAGKKEAASINGGLFVLKKCIRALNEAKAHVPYLESKLTMLLKGTIGGSSCTFTLVVAAMDFSNRTVNGRRSQTVGRDCLACSTFTLVAPAMDHASDLSERWSHLVP